MSRVGKQPIAVPDKVKINIDGRDITVDGGKVKLSLTHRPEVTVRVEDDGKQIIVERADDSRTAKSMHGLTRSLIQNMIVGVTEGYSKQLEVVGVGWQASLKGQTVELKVGFADTRKVDVPDGVTVEINGPIIKVSGPDKQMVGQVAAEIRSHRKPEPYNGKGIKYSDEVVARKEGKALAGGG